jgi:hypothetical protein
MTAFHGWRIGADRLVINSDAPTWLGFIKIAPAGNRRLDYWAGTDGVQKGERFEKLIPPVILRFRRFF